MTLDQLAKDISASAEAEAEATIKAAKEEAEAIPVSYTHLTLPTKG